MYNVVFLQISPEIAEVVHVKGDTNMYIKYISLPCGSGLCTVAMACGFQSLRAAVKPFRIRHDRLCLYDTLCIRITYLRSLIIFPKLMWFFHGSKVGIRKISSKPIGLCMLKQRGWKSRNPMILLSSCFSG